MSPFFSRGMDADRSRVWTRYWKQILEIFVVVRGKCPPQSSTPLVFAVRCGPREVVALALERGADPNRAGARPVGNAAEVQHGDA